MSLHKSFETTNNKLEKIFNQTEDNQNDIDKNIKIIDTDYTSTHFNKKIISVDLLNNFLIPSSTSPETLETKSFAFRNLNKELITNSKLSIELKSNNPNFDFNKLLPKQPNPLTLEAFWIERKNIKWWWEKTGDLWTLFVKFNVSFQRVTSLDPPISTKRVVLDVYTDVKLYLINNRNLNAVQSK